jgi:8-oxo-dGTP diphosphatase
VSGRFCWRCGRPLAAVPPTTCAACGEVHYVNPKPCGNAVVVHDGRVLLVLRARDPDAGAWTVPGGFCEGDEHPRVAAERELAEETGVRGRAVAYLGTWMDRYGEPAPDGLTITTAVSGYLVAPDDPDAALVAEPAEALEVRWWDVWSLPSPLAFQAHVPAMITAGVAMAALAAAGSLPIMYDADQ